MDNDEVLVERIRLGDQAALTTLVERHHAPLLGYLFRLTNSHPALAEDLAQETFIRFLQNITGFQSGRPFKPWLYTIATNLARDHFRRLETRQTEAWSDILEEKSSRYEAEPEPTFLKQENNERVAAAVQQLNQAQREVLLLRFYNELSLEEIARSLDLPLGTVKSRLFNAIRQLQKTLAVDPVEVSP